MRILVAGATGAVGSRLVPRLVAAGHAVTGLTRSPAKVETLSAAGAAATVVDALDFAALRLALLDARPEVVIHKMTAISNASDLAHFDRAFAATNRLRTDGVDYLLAAPANAERAASLRRASAAGRLPEWAVRSRRKRTRWIQRRRASSVILWPRSIISKAPLRARQRSKAWFCAMERSTDRAPGCSMERSLISSAAGACP